MTKEDVQSLFDKIQDVGLEYTLIHHDTWDRIDSRIFQQALLDYRSSTVKMEEALEKLGNMFGLEYEV